jgi:hypothetical protein
MTLKRSTSSRADSPANLFRLRVDGKLKPIRVGSGRSSYASCLRYDPVSFSWRTYSDSSIGAWPTSSVVFPRAGTMLNGVAYRRPMWVRPTSDSGSLSWPTPKGSPDKMGRPRPNDRGDLQAAVTQMPTPTANRRSGLQSHGKNAILGQLNPTWVEWLMGFPLGWTDLEGSETPSSPK